MHLNLLYTRALLLLIRGNAYKDFLLIRPYLSWPIRTLRSILMTLRIAL